MLEETAAGSSAHGIEDGVKEKLLAQGVWAMFLSPGGQCIWTVDLPEELPAQYTVQDVAVFSRGYLRDYPVFVWDDGDGLLVLGYPKGSYTKIISNYYSTNMIEKLPIFFTGILVFDLLLLFGVFYLSKMKLVKDTGPIVSSIKTLAEGKPVSLSPSGELSEVAESVNKASELLSRQNEARANWISGVSHDIRTPLSMIMGYSARIARDSDTDCSIRDQAKIIQSQSRKIKTLVEDLNLVSRLEYEMQPLHTETMKLSKLLRSYLAELLNGGFPENDTVDIEIAPAAENVMFKCDARMVSRAVNNLVQNSINHNPQGCHIRLSLDCDPKTVFLVVSDDGIGLSPEKLKELNGKTHYMDSTDDRLNLRHGLGLVLVRQITEAHGGTICIESQTGHGFQTILSFPL